MVLGLIAGNVEEQVESGVSALTMEPIFVDVNFEEFVNSPLSSIRFDQNEQKKQMQKKSHSFHLFWKSPMRPKFPPYNLDRVSGNGKLHNHFFIWFIK